MPNQSFFFPSRSARREQTQSGPPLGGPTNPADARSARSASTSSAVGRDGCVAYDLEFCFRRALTSGRIPKSGWTQVRERIRRSESQPLIGEPMIEDPLPSLDILSAWAPHRRITITWPALVRFFEGHIPHDRLSFRRAERVGTKAARATMVKRCLGSFFVPLSLCCDHPVVATAVEAAFLTQMHIWLFAMLGDDEVGLDFVSDLHDRTPSFGVHPTLVDGLDCVDVQLAWELTAASGRFFDPADLWLMIKPSSIETAKAEGTALNLSSRGLADGVDRPAVVPNEVQYWWPPAGLFLREMKTLRFFSSVLADPRAGREGPPESCDAHRRARLTSAVLFEKLIVLLRAVQDEMSYRKRVPIIPDRTIREVTRSCQRFLSGDRKWSWVSGSLCSARLLAAMNGAHSVASSSHTSSDPILRGDALRFVRLDFLPGFASVPAPGPSVSRAEREPPMATISKRPTTVAQPVVSTGMPPSVDPGSSSTDNPSVTVSIRGIDVPSDDSPDHPVTIGPPSRRRTLIASTTAHHYCLRTNDLLAAYPGLSVALINLDLTKMAFVNLREVLQGASGAIRTAEGKDPGRLRAARGGNTGTIQSRRNTALTLENHELHEQVAQLRKRLDVALDQVGQLGALALQSASHQQRRARDEAPEDRDLKRRRL